MLLPEMVDVNFGADLDDKKLFHEMNYSSTPQNKSQSLLLTQQNLSEEEKINLNDSMAVLYQKTTPLTDRTQNNVAAAELLA